MDSNRNEDLPSIIPTHVAIIMDGNGRWALARGLPRLAGHRAGTENLRRVIEALYRVWNSISNHLRVFHRELGPARRRSQGLDAYF